MKSLKRFLGLALMMLMAAVCFAAVGSAAATAATYKETVVFSFDSTSGWWGDVTPTLITTGQKEGTGYFSTSGKIMCGNLAGTIDLSDAQALKLWVYISDASKLVQTGPQLFLDVTHKQNEPIHSTFWTKSGLVTGWNELIFHMSESASTTETKLSEIKFIHVRIDTTAAVTFGLDSLRKLVPIQPTVTQLDTFETLTNHWGTGTLQLVSTGAPQGTSYVKVVTPDANNAYVIAGSWTAVDLRNYAADGIVKIKVYVDNAANLLTGANQGVLELKDNASGMIVWNNLSTQLVTGWNQLTLKISQAASNNANLASIASFRFFQYTNASGTFFGLDDLFIMNEAATNQEMKIFSFDDTTGWWGDITAPSLFTSGQKEGTGFFAKVTTTSQTDTVMAGDLASTVDITDAVALKMWVYVSDASKLVMTGPQFYLDITHVASSPTNTTSWTASGLHSGWNELTFKMSDAAINGTTLSAIKFIQVRIVPAMGRDVTFGVDSLREIVPKMNPDNYDPKYASALRQIDATDIIATRNNYSSSIYGNEKWKITGTAVEHSAIHFVNTGVIEVTSIDNKMAMSKKFSNINLSEYAASGSVYMWLYVSNASNISGGQIEFTSSLTSDYLETSWNLQNLSLVNGWNLLSLPINAANGSTNAKWSSINFFKLHANLTAQTTIKLDGIYVGSSADITAVGYTRPEATRKPFVIDHMDSLQDWGGSTLTLQTSSVPEGKGYLSSTRSSAGDIIFLKDLDGNPVTGEFSGTINTARLDLREYTDSRLNVSIYVSDASKITGGQIELSSSGTADNKEIHWASLGSNIVLVNGWNHLSLEFDNGVYFGGKPNLAHLNHLRIYFNVSGAVTVGIDHLYAGANTSTKTITYASGDGTVTGTAPAAISMLPGERIALPVNPFIRSGYKFAGWSDGTNTYLGSAYYTIPSTNTTLTALWTAKSTTLLTNAIEAWELGDGRLFSYVASETDSGMSVALPSELTSGTAAKNHWGVWLKNTTFGKVLDFSIEGSYLSAESNLSSSLSSKVFTFAAWVKAPVRTYGTNHARTIFKTGALTMYLDTSGKLSVNYGSGAVTLSNTNLIDDDWHHVMITYDAATLKGYIDGTSVYSNALSSGSVSLGSNIVIGANTSYADGFDGSMAQFRIYNAVKLPSGVTSTTINSLDNTPAAPHLDLKKGIVIDRRQYWNWNPLVHEDANITPQDITNIKDLLFDHVKILITPNWLINSDGSLIEERMAFIGSILDEVEAQGFKALLCVHPEHGFKGKYMGGADQSAVAANLLPLLKWYGDFASYVAENWSANTVAIQLMTEPNSNSTAVDWDYIADRTWGAARNAAPDHTLITSSDFNGNLEKIKQMSPVTDSNLIYSFTTYEPYTIGFNTMKAMEAPYGQENFWKYINEVPYPVPAGLTNQQKTDIANAAISNVPSGMQSDAYTIIINYLDGVYDSNTAYPNNYGILYGTSWHLARASSLNTWRVNNGGNVHIMSVEFGAIDRQTPIDIFGAVSTSGESNAIRIALIRDFRESFETYDIGWSYWSYNEAFTMLKPSDRKGLRSASLVPAVFAQKVDPDLVSALLD